jgi:hypothetical protein
MSHRILCVLSVHEPPGASSACAPFVPVHEFTCVRPVSGFRRPLNAAVMRCQSAVSVPVSRDTRDCPPLISSRAGAHGLMRHLAVDALPRAHLTSDTTSCSVAGRPYVDVRHCAYGCNSSQPVTNALHWIDVSQTAVVL